MGSPSYGPLYPSTAYWLSLIGGGLILVYGFLEVTLAIVYRSLYESILPGSSKFVIAFGVVGVLIGIGIVLLGLRLRSSPGTTRTSGIWIVVLSLLSFFGGGGFVLIGLVLAFLGGFIAWRWRPPALSWSMYGPAGYNVPIRQEPGSLPWETSTSPPVRPGVPQRFCPSCGSPNVANAQFCAKCGAPMS